MKPYQEPSLKDRAYVLRFRPAGAKSDEYIPVSTFTIEKYKCGLHAGDRITLIKDEGVYKKGEVFIVIKGAEEDPTCLWTLDQKGKICEWDDDQSIFDSFIPQ